MTPLFRVWDLKKKKFLDPSCFAILGTGKLIVAESGYYNHFTNVNVGDYLIARYTGLTDSKGNHIYEGDILKEWICNETKTNIGVCKSVLGGWKIFSHPDSSICWHGWKQEVIGNIFDTPELLKG